MSFPTGTEMFQFPAFALEDLCIQSTSTCTPSPSTTPKGRRRHDCQVGFPIRKFPDQRVLSPPRNLSQSATSFIASCRQGIHQTPLSRLIRPGRRPATPRQRDPGLPGPAWFIHFPCAHRTDPKIRTDTHGQHSRLGKIKILIPSGLCKPNDHFRIDLVSLHDVNEPWSAHGRPKGPNE